MTRCRIPEVRAVGRVRRTADGHAEDTEEIVQAGEAVSTLCAAVPMGSPLREVGVGCYHVTGKM